MKDTRFQALLDQLSKANSRYKELLSKAEEEYKKRYGNYPSDVDDDFWIDTFHAGEGHATVFEVDEAANLRK